MLAADLNDAPIKVLDPKLKIQEDSKIEAMGLHQPAFKEGITEQSQIILKPEWNAAGSETAEDSTENILDDIPETPKYKRLKIYK